MKQKIPEIPQRHSTLEEKNPFPRKQLGLISKHTHSAKKPALPLNCPLIPSISPTIPHVSTSTFKTAATGEETNPGQNSPSQGYLFPSRQGLWCAQTPWAAKREAGQKGFYQHNVKLYIQETTA